MVKADESHAQHSARVVGGGASSVALKASEFEAVALAERIEAEQISGIDRVNRIAHDAHALRIRCNHRVLFSGQRSEL